MDSKWAHSPWPVLALCVAGILCFATGVFVPFHGEELGTLVDSKALQGPGAAARALDAMPHAPLSLFGLALNAWPVPDDPLPLRLGNMLLHMLNAALVYLLLVRWHGPAHWFAALASAFVLLCCLPGMVSAHYLPGRSGLQAACFGLLALYLFSGAFGEEDSRPDWRKLAGAALCYVLAAGSHAGALGLPLTMLAADMARGGWKRVLEHRGIHAAALAAMLVLGRVWTASSAMEAQWTGAESPASWSAVTAYAAASLGALFRGGRTGLLSSAADAQIVSLWGALCVLLALALSVLGFLRRTPMAAGALWLLAAWIMPATGLLPSENLLTAPALYLPLVGLCLALPIAPARRQAGWVMTLGFLAGAVMATGLLHSYRMPWNDPVALWEAEAQRHPAHARAALRHAGRFALALAENAEDAALRAETLAQAETLWRKVHDTRPPEGDADAAVRLGRVLRMLGRPDEARVCFEQALRFDPAFAEASLRAGLLAAEGLQANPAQAARLALPHFQRLEKLGPLPAETHTPYVLALAASGQGRRALEFLEKLPAPPADLPPGLTDQLRQMTAQADTLRQQENAQLANPQQQPGAWLLRAQRLLLEGRPIAALYLLEKLSVNEPQAAAMLEQVKAQLLRR